MKHRRSDLLIPALAGLLINLSAGESCLALTLDEAVALARKNLPAHQAVKTRVLSAEARATESLSPYFPTLDLSGSENRIRETSPSDDSYSASQFDATVSYLVYDFGKRRAGREIALLDLATAREEVSRSGLDLEYGVKAAYYTLVAQRGIRDQRRLQLDNARTDHEVASGRYGLGVAKRSDVLKASVRLKQAEYDLRAAEGAYLKALNTLNSLIGRDPGASDDLATPLLSSPPRIDEQGLVEAARGRPEVQQAAKAVEISQRNEDLIRGTFLPDITLDAGYSSFETGGSLMDTSSEESIAGLRATWNVFEFGKIFRKRAATTDTEAARHILAETERQVFLEVRNAREDLVTAQESLVLAEDQLRDAEFSYRQALGEYRVGTGDILSLVQAETDLARSREQHVAALFDLSLSVTALERAVGAPIVHLSPTKAPQGPTP